MVSSESQKSLVFVINDWVPKDTKYIVEKAWTMKPVLICITETEELAHDNVLINTQPFIIQWKWRENYDSLNYHVCALSLWSLKSAQH